jgi:hypothetical protein
MDRSRLSPTRTGAPSGQLSPRMQLAAGVVLVVLAGLVWLMASDALAATGRRIVRLHDRRGDLVELRAEALLDLARATDPRIRESRARALGYDTPGDVVAVTIPEGGAVAAQTGDLASDSPLAVVEGGTARWPARSSGTWRAHLGLDPAPAAEVGGWGGIP